MTNISYICKELGLEKGSIHGVAELLEVDATELLTMPQANLPPIIERYLKKVKQTVSKKIINYKYVAVTLDEGEAFETHPEAFKAYEEINEEYKGVYEILEEGIKPINTSGNMFDHMKKYKIEEVAKKVADQHRKLKEIK